MSKVILSLFDRSGNWSRPYAEAGYDVRRFDLKDGDDVRVLAIPRYRVHGILAAPPCTMFALSGARWSRTPEEMAHAIALVDAALRFVAMCEPEWWALENPVGKLSNILGPPAFRFDPCEFGGWNGGEDAYTKRTCLWGRFTVPERRPVDPVDGSKMQTRVGGRPEQTEQRSLTPLGFARAFFAYNP